MGAVKLDHSDPAQHRADIMQQLRHFWMDDQFCDVVLKSHDGTEHRAHTAVLSAASVFFQNLLSGSFLEAERVQQKQPVEIAASKEAVSALLNYIYGGQPEVPVEVGLELLRLAEAYDLPKLAGEIEAGIRACLDSGVALQVLQEAHGLHSLRAACEDKVAEEFETCSQHPDFGKLTPSQLARILKREDLGVSREEAVVNALFTWNKASKDGHAFLGMLLQHVHFQFTFHWEFASPWPYNSLWSKWWRPAPGSWERTDLPKENPKSGCISVQEALFPALVTTFRRQYSQHWSFRARGTVLAMLLFVLAPRWTFGCGLGGSPHPQLETRRPFKLRATCGGWRQLRWLESMTWGVSLCAWLSHPAGRSSC